MSAFPDICDARVPQCVFRLTQRKFRLARKIEIGDEVRRDACDTPCSPAVGEGDQTIGHGYAANTQTKNQFAPLHVPRRVFLNGKILGAGR